MHFNVNEAKLIKELFITFEQNNICYTVPNGYDKLPDFVYGGDIDVLVKAVDYGRALKLVPEAFTQGNRKKSINQNGFLALAKKAINNPGRIMPAINKRLRIKNLRGSVKKDPLQDSVNPHYMETKFIYESIKLYLVNHIAFKSPMNDKRVRVNPLIEENVFRYRHQLGLTPIPSPPEEVSLLISKALFDKKGVFPDYYIARIENLLEQINNDEALCNRLMQNLELLFFKADRLVYSIVQEGDFNSLKQKLISFSDY